jgi:transposase
LAKYGQAFKDRAVARLLPPESAALEDVAREVGVGVGTLEQLSASPRALRWFAKAEFKTNLHERRSKAKHLNASSKRSA